MTDTKKPAASKVAIVTGAARGIGLATATLFAEQGLFVIMVDRDEVELQLALANLNNNSRHNHIALVCDVSSPDAVRQMIAKALEEAGRIDVLVNNAGMGITGPIEETPTDEMRNVFNTNCRENQVNCFGIDAGELRYSVGIGVTWLSGFGPLTFSLAKPLNASAIDEREVFQFTLGRGF